MKQQEVYCIVYGNVQGVFYRKFVQEKARQYGIKGYAKNLDDGTVEIVAQGDEHALDSFMRSASAGTEDAEVDSINMQKGPVEEPFTQFDIY